MQPRDVLAVVRRSFEPLDDFIECHRRRVDDLRIGWAMGQQRGGHERTGIETNGRARDQIATAYGDEVGRAGTRSQSFQAFCRSGGCDCHVADDTARHDKVRARSRRSQGRRLGNRCDAEAL